MTQDSASASLRIIAPGNGIRLLRDPSLPAEYNTIALQAEATPPLREVLWIVDGKPYQLAPYPYTVRWPLRPGEHTIQARSALAPEASAPIRIRVE
jgi:penicillin-binding protein 1C